MSEVKVNKISPRSGTTVTLGDSGDTITLASGVSLTGVNATFSGDLTVDTDTLYVDSANNEVGMGTTSPDGKLHIMSDSAGTVTASTSGNDLVVEGTGATGISILAPNDQNANILFGDPDDNDTGAIQYRHSDNSLRFFLNGSSEKMQIDSSGKVGIGTTSPSQALDVVGSIEVSGNIYLGGTTSVNALNDYEEGTFTVTNAGDATGALSAETGEYTKVGNIVFIRITFDVSTNFTSFGRIGGLPFTTSGDGTVSSFYPANVMTDSSTNSQILPNFHTNQTYMTLKEDDTNLNDHFPNTTNNIYRICGFYFTNS